MKITKIVKIAAAVAGILFLGLIALVYARQDRIANYAVQQLNNSLIEPAEIGDVSLSIFSNFPNITIQLKQVALPGAYGLDLLYAENFDVVIGIGGLLSGKYNTRKMELSHAWINIHYNESGQANYLIWKESETEENENDTPLHWKFNKISLNEVTVHYHDKKSGTEAMVRIPDGHFSGNIAAGDWKLGHQVNFHIEQLIYENETYLEDVQFGLSGTADYHADKDILYIQNMGLQSNKSEIFASGEIAFFEQAKDFNLTFSGSELDIGDLVALLPAQYRSLLFDWKSDGNLKANGSFSGKMEQGVLPELVLNFELNKGKLRHPDLKNAITDVSINGKVHVPSGKSSLRNARLDFPQISLKAGREPIQGSLLVNNFENPTIKTNWNGSVNLDAWVALLQSEQITKPGGLITFNNFSFEGSTGNLLDPTTPFRANIGGNINLQNVGMHWNDKPLKIPAANIKLSSNEIEIANTSFEGFGIKSELNGKAQNIWPYLFGKSTVGTVKVSGKIAADYLDLDQLLNDLPIGDETAASESTNHPSDRPNLSDLINGSIDISIGKFTWQKVVTSDWDGKLSFSKARIDLSETNCRGMEGQFSLAGYIAYPDRIRLMLAIEAANLNSAELFRQFENFSQTSVTDKNVSGLLSGRVYVDIHWDEAGNFLANDLEVLADVTIQNGRLKNVEMFESFATYARLDDLRDIELVNMRNVFEFSNLTFRIPVMFIQNNALNISLAGEHLYDHRIDYQIAVNATQVALNRMNPFRNAGQTLPAGNGGLILFYRIYGTTDEFKFQADRSFVQGRFEQTAHQRTRLENRIQTIFNQQKPGTVIQTTSNVPKIDNFDFLLEPSSGRDGLEYIDFDE